MIQAPAFKVTALGGRTCVREAEYSSASRYMVVTGSADRAAVAVHCSDEAMSATLRLRPHEARALAAELLACVDAVETAAKSGGLAP